MRVLKILLSATILTVSSTVAPAQTINWGSEFFSSFRDSSGVTLTSGSFVFELGTFVDIDPDETNTAVWSEKWRVFDRTAYTESTQYFTSSVEMNDSGTSLLSAGSPSFENKPAYLWVRNSDIPQPGSEWLLVRDPSWVFPVAIPGCCNNGLPLAWSLSDLGAGDVPEWGSQNGVGGPGTSSAPDNSTLQTYTFLQAPIPEPSALVFLGLSVLGLLRRQRSC